jgi:D-alanyl-D-alanine carboxypeptidase (penicillin-binding protein 5/6)
VLFSQNEQKKRPMASLTKIVTAITVLENYPDITKKISVPAKAVGVEGSSIYLAKDEIISVQDLLYGLMLRSGNDAAVALAITVSGSVEKFATLMNKTAQKAGAKNSNFVNPNGLHHSDHYTTALDLALITSYGMKNETFKKIVGTRLYKMDRNRSDCPKSISNKNKLLSTLEGADGVKTGYTKKAGRCLVSSATRNGMQVICVVLNCGPMFEECAALTSAAFSEYKMQPIASKNAEITQVAVRDGKKSTVGVGTKTDILFPLKASEKVVCVAEPVGFVKAGTKAGTKAGKVSFRLENRLLFETELYTIEYAAPMSFGGFIHNILGNW